MRKKQEKIKNPSEANRQRRKLRIRKTVIGTSQRPRICTNKTNKHIFVQVIDDAANKTLFSVQTFGKNAVQGASGNIEGGKLVGARVAELLKEKKIENAVYDRNGFRYAGVVASVASSIRENGIQV
jgi:large subunit ribosomal protein L18